MTGKESEILTSIIADIEASDDKIEPLERLLCEVKKMINSKQNDTTKKREILEQFNIVDFCIDNYYNKTPGGGAFLADAFKDLHDKYGWNYADIHAKFKREVDSRRNEVFIVRTSEIWLTRDERKQLPLYNNQWYTHLHKMNNKEKQIAK